MLGTPDNEVPPAAWLSLLPVLGSVTGTSATVERPAVAERGAATVALTLAAGVGFARLLGEAHARLGGWPRSIAQLREAWTRR
ncbi:MAG: hypothetical protein H6732_16555 [Alphaproteobacteria bacterium]|nr:hypothetical protein [Alphaproteobacteria bacterium]